MHTEKNIDNGNLLCYIVDMDLNFFRHLLQNPSPIGAVAPLSERAAVGLTKYVRSRSTKKPCRILEAGAGTGSVTQLIVPSLRDEDHLDLVEIEAEFCQVLQEKFGAIPQIKIHCQSVFDWHPESRYDYIISTLPLNIFPPEDVERLFGLYQKLLANGGICTYVEYIGLARLGLLFSMGETKKRNQQRRAILAELHRNYLIGYEDILTNFLPCRVYHLKFKKDAGPS